METFVPENCQQMARPLSILKRKTENLTNFVRDDQSTLLLSIWKIILSLRQTKCLSWLNEYL